MRCVCVCVFVYKCCTVLLCVHKLISNHGGRAGVERNTGRVVSWLGIVAQTKRLLKFLFVCLFLIMHWRCWS